MKNYFATYLLVASFLFAASRAKSQEMLIPLAGLHSGQETERIEAPRLKVTGGDTLELPFFDDFSRPGTLPDPGLWSDTYAYRNNSFDVDPVSIGVATLDAVDAEGRLNIESPVPESSDYLTSLPVNLNYPGRKDVYLSFFYQPQGLGDNPETGDSLLVDFYDPAARQWINVWSVEGSQSTDFRQVFLPVDDPAYLVRGFRFRFRNYASLPASQSFPSNNSNVDQWNIDYVYLDTARSPEMTAVNDVAMVSSLGGLLKDYESIPWPHFKRAYQRQIKARIPIVYRNNDTTDRNVTRLLEITDLTNFNQETFSEGAINLPAGSLDTCAFLYNFPFFPYEADSVLFRIRSYLVTDKLDYKWNDTVSRYQEFYNYYAYDDGSAEVGYGLQGEGTIDARVACHFYSFEPDTLRGVKMYFNRTLNDAGRDYFKLCVWSRDPVTNRPGILRYSMQGVRPEYGDDLNQYEIYEFDTVLTVNEDFYVGWIKTTTNMLNIGFDRNNDNRDQIFYNLGQDWTPTSFHGSLMIRPLIGHKLSYPAAADFSEEEVVTLYPNPADRFIRLEFRGRAEQGRWDFRVVNLQGIPVMEGQATSGDIDVSRLPAGMYVLSLTNSAGRTSHKKFMVRR